MSHENLRGPAKLQKWCRTCRLAGETVALVPTMGYLHEGHLSLIAKAKAKGADEIVVSVFVNPVQFCPGEDYEKYPRDEKADLAKCRAAGATAVFFPTPENMYLDRHSVYVTEEDLSKGLCGARRPGHFRGVCTVVAKLFNLAHPNFAVFGQKDYQQAQVIRRMVRDLNFDWTSSLRRSCASRRASPVRRATPIFRPSSGRERVRSRVRSPP